MSYTTPAVALLSVAPVTSAGLASPFTDALAVTVVHPAPTGGQPQRAYARIWKTATTRGDYLHPEGRSVLAARFFVDRVFLDARVVPGVDYVYQVETVAANGTSSLSELVGDFRDLTSGAGAPVGGEGDFADADFDPADFA